MKYFIFTSMALLIAKIAVFEVWRIHVWLTKNKCTRNVSLFDADFGQETSLDYIFENEAATVNGARHDNTVLSAEMDNIDVANMWFQ